MTAPSKIEEVARAIWTAAGFASLHPEGFANRPIQVRERYLRDAIAAVRALREPTEGMTDATDDMDIYWGYLSDGRPGGPNDVWRAMIDAILADTGER